MAAASLVLVGIIALLVGVIQLRDYKSRQGDFSAWMVSDATPLNRRLWLANSWIRLIGLLFIGAMFLAWGVWLLVTKV